MYSKYQQLLTQMIDCTDFSDMMSYLIFVRLSGTGAESGVVPAQHRVATSEWGSHTARLVKRRVTLTHYHL